MQITKLFPICALAAALCVPSAHAWPKKHHARAGGAASVTGCLQKGGAANEYHIVANGKTFDLYPTGSVNMADHVGHKVTVKGNYRGQSGATSTSASRMEEQIDVTSLKHISDTCK